MEIEDIWFDHPVDDKWMTTRNVADREDIEALGANKGIDKNCELSLRVANADGSRQYVDSKFACDVFAQAFADMAKGRLENAEASEENLRRENERADREDELEESASKSPPKRRQSKR